MPGPGRAWAAAASGGAHGGVRGQTRGGSVVNPTRSLGAQLWEPGGRLPGAPRAEWPGLDGPTVLRCLSRLGALGEPPWESVVEVSRGSLVAVPRGPAGGLPGQRDEGRVTETRLAGREFDMLPSVPWLLGIQGPMGRREGRGEVWGGGRGSPRMNEAVF